MTTGPGRAAGSGDGALVNPGEGDQADSRGPLPPEWRADVEARLEVGEAVAAWFSPDLDNRLHYGTGLVVLTDRRLLHGEPAREGDGEGGRRWRSWPLAADLGLRARDRAGLGTLELV